MRTLALLVIGLGLMAQAEAGTDLVESCAVCHGPDGVSRWSDVPNIAGLPEIVIANALYDYRGHSRPCRKGACAADGSCPNVDMCELARPLTDGEMDILARYYSARPFSPSVADYDESKAAAGSGIHQQYCETCHSGGGSNPQDEASILRGQNMQYIRNALGDYRSGARLGEEEMLRHLKALDDDEIDALAHFYASPMN
ncbi:MAG: c-type cytochrome [Gammaproteobacteria bacterium]|nr:MAG: c-type cytochrome [Gammaproteobacteria bacterium]